MNSVPESSLQAVLDALDGLRPIVDRHHLLSVLLGNDLQTPPRLDLIAAEIDALGTDLERVMAGLEEARS